MKSVGLFAAVCLALGATTAIAMAQCNYEVVELPVPDCGLIPSLVTVEDLNDQGIVVGRYRQCDLEGDAIYYWSPDEGLRTDIYLPPNADSAGAMAINNLGQVTGWAITSDGSSFAWVWTDGSFATIDIPDGMGNFIEPRGINDHGDVVGWFGTSALGERHAFLWNDGRLTILDDAVQSTAAIANDISNAGHIVGWYVSDGSNGFLLDNGVLTVLDTLPCAQFTRPQAVNDLGEVVGQVTCEDPDIKSAVRWDAGEVSELPRLEEGQDARASTITNAGLIGGRSGGGCIWVEGEPVSLSELSGYPEIGSAIAINTRGQVLIFADELLLQPLTTPADLTLDCRVDAHDLALLLSEWGSTDSPADLVADGVVDAGDLAVLLSAWSF